MPSLQRWNQVLLLAALGIRTGLALPALQLRDEPDETETVYETRYHTITTACGGSSDLTQLPDNTASAACSIPTSLASLSSSIILESSESTAESATSAVLQTSIVPESSYSASETISVPRTSSTLETTVSYSTSTTSSSTPETTTKTTTTTTTTTSIPETTSVSSTTISTSSSQADITSTSTTTFITTTATNSTSAASATSTPTDDDSWFGEGEGIPPLTEEDIHFIMSERTLAEAGFPDSDGSTAPLPAHEKRQEDGDFFGGANTKEKWDNLKMDAWLQKYVAAIDIPGQTGKKLADSTNFFSDFWLSTGEENIVVCDTLLDTCNVAEVSDEKRFPNISRNNALRAQFVRQVIKVFQSSNKQSRDILKQAVSDAQLNILTAHKLFVQDTPPPATKLFDVLIPAVAAISAFVPVLAPAAELMAGMYAVSKALSRRDDVVVGEIQWTDNAASAADIPLVNHTSTFEKRQINDDTREVLVDILNRVIELEQVPPNKWIDDVNKGVGKVAAASDSAAKMVVAFKGLNPKLPRSTITSWDTFDLQVQQALLSFPDSIVTSFDQIKLSWLPRESTNADGTTIIAAGMRSVLLGGGWARVSAHTEPPSASGAKVKKYLDAVIFMQYVQQQAIYFWTQTFNSEGACRSARDDAISNKWLATDGWYNCENINGKWEFQYARKPTTNRGSATATKTSKWSPYGDIVALGYKPEGSPQCFVQERSGNVLRTKGFEQNTAGLNKWNDNLLSAISYDFRMNDVFKASRACQAELGDPFTPTVAPRSAFYPSMRLRSSGEQVLSGILPQCLFNMPIFAVGRSDLDDWCTSHIGVMHSNRGFVPDKWSSDHEVCGDKLELWAIQSDTKLCGSNQGDYLPTRDSRPGCSLHEQGVMQVYCAGQIGQ